MAAAESPVVGHVPAHPSRTRVIIAFAAVYIIWGSTYLAIRHAITTIPPLLMAGTRFIIAGGIMTAWTLARGAAKPDARAVRSTIIVGALLLMGGNGAVVYAEQYVPSGMTALIVATMPFWMVLLEAFRPGGAKPTKRVVIGLVLGLIGLFVLVGPSSLGGNDLVVSPLGTMILMGGCLSWAAGSIYSRHATLPRSPLLTTGIEMISGGVLLVLLGTVFGEWSNVHFAAITADSWLAMLYLVIFGSLIGFTAYVWLLGVAPAAKVATYAYVNPVVAVFLGWLIDKDPFGPRVIVAAAIILGSVAVITQTGTKKPASTTARTPSVPRAASRKSRVAQR